MCVNQRRVLDEGVAVPIGYVEFGDTYTCTG